MPHLDQAAPTLVIVETEHSTRCCSQAPSELGAASLFLHIPLGRPFRSLWTGPLEVSPAPTSGFCLLDPRKGKNLCLPLGVIYGHPRGFPSKKRP